MELESNIAKQAGIGRGLCSAVYVAPRWCPA